MIPPHTDLDNDGTRLLTHQRAHASSVEHLDALTSLAAGIGATVSGRSVPGDPSDIDPVGRDRLDDDRTDDLTYRAALAARAALSGVVQRSLRDFLA